MEENVSFLAARSIKSALQKGGLKSTLRQLTTLAVFKTQQSKGVYAHSPCETKVITGCYQQFWECYDEHYWMEVPKREGVPLPGNGRPRQHLGPAGNAPSRSG
jgi:hypothetical protein